jgi:hypothetical protein
MPAPAPASTVDPSLDSLGVAGRINDDLEPALEKALGIDLTVELLGEYPSGGGTKVNIAYALKADLPLSDDLSAKFSEVFESLGANISSADGAFGKLGFAFEGLRAGVTVDGRAYYAYNNALAGVIEFALTVTNDPSTPTPTPVSPLASPVAPLVASGTAGRINDDLEPARKKSWG